MTDPLASFADLQRDFPGKKVPVNRKPKTAAPVIEAWDAHPRTYKVKGVETEFFTISHLALAVGRSTRTIRHWEKYQTIPPATFRAPKPKSGPLKQVGDRLYSREQIEAIVAAADEEGVLDGKAPSKRFTAKVVRAWRVIQQQRGST